MVLAKILFNSSILNPVSKNSIVVKMCPIRVQIVIRAITELDLFINCTFLFFVSYHKGYCMKVEE